MIVRDEEQYLPAVLEATAGLVDEVVIVDTGSTDRTREIALEHGARLFDAPWEDHFGAARNTSFELCHSDWVLWLDADDRLPGPTRLELTELKKRLNDDVDAVVGPYHNDIAEDGLPLLIRYTPRLLRRQADIYWEGSVYERVVVAPGRSVPDPRLVVEHRPDRERRARTDKLRWSLLEGAVASGDESPSIRFHYGNHLYDRKLFREAAMMYRQYLAKDEEGADRYWAWVYLAESLDAVGDAAGVRDAATKAILEDPSRAEAYVTLGRLYFAAEEWSEAVPLFTAATAGRRPPYGLTRNADYVHAPWDYLSVCYEKLGQYDKSLEAGLKALRSNPQAARVKTNMRWVIGQLPS